MIAFKSNTFDFSLSKIFGQLDFHAELYLGFLNYVLYKCVNYALKLIFFYKWHKGKKIDKAAFKNQTLVLVIQVY